VTVIRSPVGDSMGTLSGLLLFVGSSHALSLYLVSFLVWSVCYAPAPLPASYPLVACPILQALLYYLHPRPPARSFAIPYLVQTVVRLANPMIIVNRPHFPVCWLHGSAVAVGIICQPRHSDTKRQRSATRLRTAHGSRAPRVREPQNTGSRVQQLVVRCAC